MLVWGFLFPRFKGVHIRLTGDPSLLVGVKVNVFFVSVNQLCDRLGSSDLSVPVIGYSPHTPQGMSHCTSAVHTDATV